MGWPTSILGDVFKNSSGHLVPQLTDDFDITFYFFKTRAQILLKKIMNFFGKTFKNNFNRRKASSFFFVIVEKFFFRNS
jgi:hypothetical protein